MPLGRYQSILVRAPNWIGDQILAYPFFHYLREAYPQARIAVACHPWVESVQFRNLVNEVHLLPRPDRPGLWAKVQSLREAASELKSKGPWDLAISLPNSFSTAALLYLAGAKERRGYVADGRGILLTDPVVWASGKEQHRSEAYARLIPGGETNANTANVREFWGVPPVDETDPGVPGVLPKFPVREAWPQVKMLEPPTEDYWVLAPGTTAESRRWPLESFKALARRVVSERGWKGVIVGGPMEAPVAERLCDERGLKLEDWTAQGSVASLWKIFRHAKFTVANDSGLAHVAALCGSPVQVAWGAGDPKRTRPMGPGKVQLALNPVDCWPCERNTCSLPDARKLECLRGVQPETIWEEVVSGFRI